MSHRTHPGWRAAQSCLSLPTTRLSRSSSRAIRWFCSMTSFSVSAIFPAMPVHSNGRRAEKSPFLNDVSVRRSRRSSSRSGRGASVGGPGGRRGLGAPDLPTTSLASDLLAWDTHRWARRFLGAAPVSEKHAAPIVAQSQGSSRTGRGENRRTTLPNVEMTKEHPRPAIQGGRVGAVYRLSIAARTSRRLLVAGASDRPSIARISSASWRSLMQSRIHLE